MCGPDGGDGGAASGANASDIGVSGRGGTGRGDRGASADSTGADDGGAFEGTGFESGQEFGIGQEAGTSADLGFDFAASLSLPSEEERNDRNLRTASQTFSSKPTKGPTRGEEAAQMAASLRSKMSSIKAAFERGEISREDAVRAQDNVTATNLKGQALNTGQVLGALARGNTSDDELAAAIQSQDLNDFQSNLKGLMSRGADFPNTGNFGSRGSSASARSGGTGDLGDTGPGSVASIEQLIFDRFQDFTQGGVRTTQPITVPDNLVPLPRIVPRGGNPLTINTTPVTGATAPLTPINKTGKLSSNPGPGATTLSQLIQR